MVDPDNLTEAYAQRRQEADTADLDEWWSQRLTPTAPPVNPRALGQPQPQAGPQGLTAKVGQVVGEGARMIGGGVVDALTHTFKALEFGQEGSAGVQDVVTPPLTGEAPTPATPSALIPQVPRTGSMPLDMARDLIGVAATVAVASASGAPPLLAGMVGDYTASAGMQGRLTDLLTSFAPGLKDTPLIGPLATFLESDPDDTKAMAGFKSAVEGVIAGALLSGGVKAVRAGLHPTQTAEQITDAFRQLRDSPTGQLLREESGAIPIGPGGVEPPRPEAPTPAAAPRPAPQVAERPVAELTLDPQRFQYKVQQGAGGATGSLAGVQQYDPNLAGIIQVWTDPADGKTYVVNGHNRVDLATRLGAETIPVRYLAAETAEEARTIGALTNVAEGRGNPIDAAKLFRDTGLTVEDLKARGIPLRERIAADGLALANLQESLFNDVIQGQLPLERAIVIGSKVADPDQQLKLVQLLREQPRVNLETVRELADFVQAAPSEQVLQDTLFGAEEVTQSLALDKARLAGSIREQLSKDKTLFARVSQERSAQRLTEAGNIIHVEEAARIAEQSERLLNIFDRLKYRAGPISDILNDAAGEIRAGGSLNDIRPRTYQRLTAALPEAVRGAEAESLSGAATGVRPGEFTTSTGDQLLARAERPRGAVSEAGVPIRDRPVAPSVSPEPPAGEAPTAGKTFYHGGSSPMTEWRHMPEAANPHDNQGLGIFFTPDEGSAKNWAGEGGAVTPVRLDLKHPYTVDTWEDLKRQFVQASQGRLSTAAQIKASLQAQGYDGVILRNPTETEIFGRDRGFYIAFEPASIKNEAAAPPAAPPRLPPEAPPTGGLPPEPPQPPRGPYTPEAEAARQLLSGQGYEDVAGRINLARITAPERVQVVLDTVNKLNVESGATETAVRGVVSHADTLDASRGRVTIESLLAREPGEMLPGIPLNEQITAARRLRTTSGRYLTGLAERVTTGDQDAAAVLYDALAVHGRLDDAVTGMSAEVGRALEAHKIGAAAERGVFDAAALGELADRLRGVSPEAQAAAGGLPVVISPERLAQMISAAQRAAGREGVNTMARQATQPGVTSMLMEAWINGLLSNPPTHLANALSNSVTAFWAVGERALAARLHPGVAEGVMTGEATAMLHGLVEGFGDALQLAFRAVRRGEASFGGASKTEISRAISGETLQLTGPLGRAVDLVGEVIRLPGRALIASDEFFKAINYRMELRAQVFRQATREGLEGDALVSRMTQLVAEPPRTIKAAAEGHAFYQTFNQELGPTGQAFMSFANSHPAIRLILPFIRTPTNIFKYSLERMPVLNLLLSGVRDDLRLGGVRRDLALAKTALGGLVMGTAGVLAASGMITGDGPHDPVLRKRLQETGWQPYSLKIGHTYYSYNRLDPLGALLGIAANIGELRAELPQADLDQVSMAAVLGTMEAMTSKSYLQGLSSVLDAIRSPDQKGLNYLRSLARSLIPAGVAGIERSLDPTVREVHGLLDEMRARVPGYSADLPPRRNLWGEPIILEGGLGPDLISPIYTNTLTDDPVSTEIVRQRVALKLPEKVIGGSAPPRSPFAGERASHGVVLTPAEYDLYVRLAGNQLKLQGQGLHDRLAELIQSPRYQDQTNGPDGGKAYMIRKTVQVYRQAAEARLSDPHGPTPELAALIRAREVERLHPRLPSAAGLPAGLALTP